MTTITATPDFEAAINLLSDLALKHAGAQALDAAIIVRATFAQARSQPTPDPSTPNLVAIRK